MSNQNKFLALLTSSIVLKIVMALTGAAMAGFVVVHMVGHLQMFGGREMYNEYAHKLQSLGAIKWATRLGLLGVLAAHVGAAIELTRRNSTARPQGYAELRPQKSSLAGRTMALSGLTVLFYIIYHIMHFTVGAVHNEYFGLVDPAGHHDVYNNFVLSFQNPVIFGIYLIGTGFLAAHLSHALSSMFKTLGVAVGRFRPYAEMIGPAFAVFSFIGFILPPLACLFGFIDTQY